MFLLFPLSIAWALWGLEGLYLLALMGFSAEQLRVSTHLLVLTALPPQVTQSFCPIWGLGTVWAALGHRVGRRFACIWRFTKQENFVPSCPCVFLTQHFHPSCRGRSPQSSAFHPPGHCHLALHLLFGIFWCLSGTHPHGALLPDSF